MNEDFLKQKLQERIESESFRQLHLGSGDIDFCSNDYLGIVKSGSISFEEKGIEKLHGSTGSRLISGNYELICETEKMIAAFHEAEAGLMFNSGYDANIGLLSCVPRREDMIIYDQLSHASLRDGIRLSNARSFAFAHNDVEDLEKKLKNAIKEYTNNSSTDSVDKTTAGRIFVVTESVFSMDGHLAPLAEISGLCDNYDALLIIDEAHATGVIGSKGEGLVQHLNLQQKCFARVHTFGKAVGTHGAIVLGSNSLRDYLINFSRPFIYTTAMPASAVKATALSYSLFPSMSAERSHLNHLIALFRSLASSLQTTDSVTPIQSVIISGNEPVRAMAAKLQANGFDIRAILYPTVPKGSERLRIVLHAFNTEDQLKSLFKILEAKVSSGGGDQIGAPPL